MKKYTKDTCESINSWIKITAKPCKIINKRLFC